MFPSKTKVNVDIVDSNGHNNSTMIKCLGKLYEHR